MFKEPSGTLLIIAIIAFTAPLLTSLAPKLRLPALVLEIVLGIIVGPQVLDIVEVSEPIAFFGELGLASLIFLAGFELDPARVKGEPMKLASAGWVISILLGLASAVVLRQLDIIATDVYVGLALTTTALGALLPVMRDGGILQTRLGTDVLAVGSVGEFGPIVAVALFLGGTSPLRSAVSLAVFALVAFAAVRQAGRPQHPRLQQALGATLRTSGQLYIRAAVLLLAALTFFAHKLGLDVLLGAFTAGIVFRLLMLSGADHEQVEQIETKLEAVTMGYLVPVFFVLTGVQFNLDALVHSPTGLLKLPLFLALLLVVRGVPVLLYRKELPAARDRAALAFFSAAGLPLIVAITTIGVSTGHMRTSTAAALVGAGMLSIIIFPVVGKALLGKAGSGAASEAPATAPDPAV